MRFQLGEGPSRDRLCDSGETFTNFRFELYTGLIQTFNIRSESPQPQL